MKKYIVGMLAGAALAVSFAIVAQQGGSGKPGGSTNSTQYRLNSTTFGGAGPGTAGQVLTSNGAGSPPSFQAGTSVTPSALTRTNDTNVTLTLGGTPNTALLQATSITAGWTGDLAFDRLTQGTALSVLANATNGTADFASLAAASDNQVLRHSGTALAFGAINLASTSAVTGTLPAGNGGVGITTVTDDTTIVGSGSAWVSTAIGSCSAASSALTYNTTTNAFGCNTISASAALTTGQVGFGVASVLGAPRDSPTSSRRATPSYSSRPLEQTPELSLLGTARLDRQGAIGMPTVSGTNNGNSLVISGGDATTSGTGGSLLIQSGQGAGGSNDGAMTVRCRANGCPVDIRAGSDGAGIIRIDSPSGTRRINVNGANSAATGIQFVGYGTGTITSDASGNLTSVSDERVKRDIRPYLKGLAAIETLDPIQYGYTPESKLDQTKDDYSGFSAQDVEEAFPEAVGHSADGLRSLDERAIIAALVNSVKELNARIAELEGRE